MFWTLYPGRFLCSLLTICCLFTQASWTIEGSSLPLDWPQTGTIEFQDYGLQYRKGLELALKGITLHIREREKVSLRQFQCLRSSILLFTVSGKLYMDSD